MTWTPERVETLKQLWGAGQTAVSIGQTLGVSEKSIGAKIKRLGIQRGQHDWPQDRADRLKAMWAENVSLNQIAAKLGVTRSAVLGKVARLGLARRQTFIPSRRGGGTHAPTAPTPRIVWTPPADLPPSLSVSLLALEAGQCRWPDEEGATFCGHPVTPGKPYCSGHCAAAFRAPRNKPGVPAEPRRRSGFDGWEIAA